MRDPSISDFAAQLNQRIADLAREILSEPRHFPRRNPERYAEESVHWLT